MEQVYAVCQHVDGTYAQQHEDGAGVGEHEELEACLVRVFVTPVAYDEERGNKHEFPTEVEEQQIGCDEDSKQTDCEKLINA